MHGPSDSRCHPVGVPGGARIGESGVGGGPTLPPVPSPSRRGQDAGGAGRKGADHRSSGGAALLPFLPVPDWYLTEKEGAPPFAVERARAAMIHLNQWLFEASYVP